VTDRRFGKDENQETNGTRHMAFGTWQKNRPKGRPLQRTYNDRTTTNVQRPVQRPRTM